MTQNVQLMKENEVFFDINFKNLSQENEEEAFITIDKSS